MDLRSNTVADTSQDEQNPASVVLEAPSLINTRRDLISPQLRQAAQLDDKDLQRIVQSVPEGWMNVTDVFPLSMLQEGILFHCLLNQHSDAYIFSTLLEFESRARLVQWIDAINKVAGRHDILRTSIRWEGLPKPVQVVVRKATLPVQELTLEAGQDAIECLRERMRPGHQPMIDLRQAPLARLLVAPGLHGRQYAVLALHHLVSDWESLKLLIDESLHYLEHREQELLPLQAYKEYIAYALTHADAQGAEAFFKARLAAVQEPTIPFGLFDPRGEGVALEEASRLIDVHWGRKIRAQARRHEITPARLFHAAWALVVAHTSGKDDVVFGTVLSVLQSKAGFEIPRTMGLLVNTLPLRVSIADLTVVELVRHAHRQLSELLDHVHASLAAAQRCSDIPGNGPLFSSIVSYRHGRHEIEWRSRAGLRVLGRTESPTGYPISLSIDDRGNEFLIAAQTDSRIPAARVVRYVETAIQSLVHALEEAPQTRALSLSILPEAERQQVLQLFNATQTAYPQGKLLHELFEEQVRSTPAAVAVIYEDQELSYAELNTKANQLARYLRGKGIGPDQLVGICVERSPEMVVGLLGILKAGGAYVPLDPSYPAERLQYMLDDAAPSVLLTQARLKERLPTGDAQVIALDEQWGEIAQRLGGNLDSQVLGLRPDHLAYVIYTSGSTGKPKGAMNEHRGVVNRLQWMQEQYGLGCSDSVLQKTPFSFDVSVWEFFWTLMSGACLVVARPDGHKDPGYLSELIESSGVTTLHFVPSMLQSFLERHRAGECGGLRHIVCSGEELPAALQRKCFESLPQVQLSNLYGPTEAAIDVTAWECSREDRGSRVPIGRPIANMRMYVLDWHGQPLPVGVAGELYIGGVGVARGYLNRPELTAERFVRDPFSDDPQARLYKTGDLGRWRADGAIEYLGRNDHQVKIRGFRIELGEIEAQLLRHPQVKETAVLARGDESGAKRLVAYVVAAPGVSVEALRAHLKPVLPDYMVPSAFVMLASLPLTPNGKLDRKALPAPELGAYGGGKYEAPQGEIEEILSGIWQELLGVERVGRNANFFELGGHSLLIIQMLERLRRVGLSAEVRRVLESPTLADLASVLGNGALHEFVVPPNLIPTECALITPRMLPLVQLEMEHIEQVVLTVPGGAANIKDIYPLTPLQEGILFHHLLAPEGGDAYVLGMVLSVCSRARLEELTAALQSVIDRHDVLRTAVLWEKLPEAIQVVYRKAALPVDEVSLQDGRDVMQQLQEWLEPERQRLDLRRAPLMRLQVAADPHTDQWYVLLQLHHLSGDRVTLEIITSEVVSCLEGRARELPEPVPYRNHVAQVLARADAHDAESFFRAKLGDVEEPTAPFGLLDAHDSGMAVQEAREALDAQLSQRIRAQARRAGVSAATLFHCAWGLVVAHTSGRDDVVFGSVLLGRLQGSAGALQIPGMFINTLPLRLKLQGASSKELLEQTQRELVELLGHEQASLALAQRCSAISGSTALFGALLNYRHGAADAQLGWSAAAGIQTLVARERTNYPIAMSVDDSGEGFALTAQTDRRIDPQRMTAYLHTAVRSLVQALEEQPLRAALSLSILPESERRQVLELFNATDSWYPQEKRLHQLFEEQVRRTPGEVAVTYEGQSLSYAELNAKANQLARYLTGQQVPSGQFIPIVMPRSLHMLIAQLAVLKIGGAYVPIDPEFPLERQAFMLRDCGARWILAAQGRGAQAGQESVQWIDCMAAAETIGKLSQENLDLKLEGATAAYLMYTSGSTGVPKGVSVPHGAVIRLVINNGYTRIEPTDCIAHCSNTAFDASTFEIWGALLSGARVAIIPHSVVLHTESFAKALRQHQVSILFQTTALFNQHFLEVPEIFSQLKYLLFGGEISDPGIVRHVLRNGAPRHLLHVYGPTETTTFATWYPVTAVAEDAKIVPIGRPIANTQVYILDPSLNPAPIGVTGELYIGGPGVALGYLNRPELTAERFIQNPFSADPRARLYKTGDLGKWRDDGVIEYIGRNDHQVKIRGFRIELGEIETKLTGFQQVRDAVVLAREDVLGEKRLVAYVIPEGSGATADLLRSQLRSVLPEYMVPSAFVMLEAFPLTSSGKLDRRALPAPALETSGGPEYEAPQGELEETLAEIWRKTLHVERVARNQHFFELGGHSLSAMKVAARISERFTVSLSPITLFHHPTIYQLALIVRSLSPAPVAALVRDLRGKGVLLAVKNGRLHCQIPEDALTDAEIEALQASKDDIIAMLERSSVAEVAPIPVARTPGEQIPLSLSQALRWQPSRLFLRATTSARRLRGELDLELFRGSIQDLIQRHEALRTRMRVVNGVPIQEVRESLEYDLREEDLTEVPDSLREGAISKQIAESILEPLDPAEDPLFSFKLLKLAAADHVLIIATEHMISDGVSLQILWRDLLLLYGQKLTGGVSELPEIPVHFPDYSVWQIKAHRQWMEQHGAAWTERLKDCRPARFATQAIPAATERRGWGTVQVKLDDSLTTRWRDWCRMKRTTLPLSALAVYAALLSRWCTASEVGIQYLTNGRSSPKVVNAVGFFSSVVYVRVRLQQTDTLADVMKRVIDDYWESYSIPDFCYLGAELPRPELSNIPSFNWLPKAEASQQSQSVAEPLSSEEVTFDHAFLDVAPQDPDPSLSFQEFDDDVYASVVFPNRRFSKDTMERFLGNVIELLKAMLDESESRVQDIPLT